jgi:hypothetical protein
VQLVSVSMKLRQMFYTQIERRTFHTAWTRSRHLAAARPDVAGLIALQKKLDCLAEGIHCRQPAFLLPNVTLSSFRTVA